MKYKKLYSYLLIYTKFGYFVHPHGLERSFPDRQLEFLAQYQLHWFVLVDLFAVVDHLTVFAYNRFKMKVDLNKKQN